MEEERKEAWGKVEKGLGTLAKEIKKGERMLMAAGRLPKRLRKLIAKRMKEGDGGEAWDRTTSTSPNQ